MYGNFLCIGTNTHTYIYILLIFTCRLSFMHSCKKCQKYSQVIGLDKLPSHIFTLYYNAKNLARILVYLYTKYLDTFFVLQCTHARSMGTNFVPSRILNTYQQIVYVYWILSTTYVSPLKTNMILQNNNKNTRNK